MRLLALGLLLATLSAPTAVAQRRTAALSDAERAYVDVDFEATRNAARAAIEGGGLDTRDLARAYELLAVSSAALGDEETARYAYVRLLVLAPDTRPSDILPPERRTSYQEARAMVALQDDPLSVEVRWDAAAQSVRITVRDPLGLASGVRLERFHRGAPATRADTALELGVATIPLGDEHGDVSYAATVLDAHGNHLLEHGTAETPEHLRLGESRTVAPAETGHHGLSRRTRRILIIGSAALVVVGGALTAGLVVHARHSTPLVTDVVVTPLSWR